MDKITELKGNELLIYILEKAINHACNCPMVYANRIDAQYDYPFITYNWIIVRKDLTTDILTDSAPYIAQVQLDSHSGNALNSLELINKLYACLRSSAGRRTFKQAGIVPNLMGDIDNHTISPEVNYDYCYGFDCGFTLSNSKSYKLDSLIFDYNETDIASIHVKGINDKGNTNEIDAAKNNGGNI